MSEWRERPLSDLIDLYDSKRVPRSAAQHKSRQGPYPYYGAQSVIDHIDDFIFDGRYILIPEDGENLTSRKLPIAYFAEGKFWVNNHAHIAKARPGVAVDRFVQSALESTDISGFVTGAAQPKLSQANLLRVPILAPAYGTQERIGEVLDAFDDLIENNRRRVELLEQMAQAIYREWFVHFRYPGHEHDELVDSPLGPIPSGWTTGSVADVCSRVQAGGTPRRGVSEFWDDGDVPWYKTGDLTDSVLISSCSWPG
jgi:type I restriction enzyme, S subunit